MPIGPILGVGVAWQFGSDIQSLSFTTQRFLLLRELLELGLIKKQKRKMAQLVTYRWSLLIIETKKLPSLAYDLMSTPANH